LLDGTARKIRELASHQLRQLLEDGLVLGDRQVFAQRMTDLNNQ
jgi:hypothetical protein